MINAYTGELAGLSAACLWALAAVVYFQIGKHVPPLALNLYKGVIASALLTITLAVRGELGDTLDASAVLWLLASGAVGIGVGDSAFFAALNRLGERRTVLMAETLAPPITTLFAIVALAEMLPPLAFVGMALTIAGVAWVIVEKGARDPDYPFDGARLRAGIVWATTAALCQAVGAVTSRGVLTQTDTGPLWSALIRMLGGVAILLLWLPATRRPFFPAAARNPRVWRWILVAAFLGTYLGIFLQQLALQHTDAGVAQTLLATSSLFVLPLVIARGESVSAQAACGAAAAVCGVALLFAAS